MTSSPSHAPRQLTAGPLRCWLMGADLRRITVGGVEVVQRIYAAVRDGRWATLAMRVTRQEIAQTADGFHVITEVDGEHGGIAYHARLVHTGSGDGTLRVTYDGEALSAFASMRIGLCILHPLSLAGTVTQVDHDDGTAEAVMLPITIAPWQPAYRIRTLTTAVAGARIRLEFSGTVFEMEDQRNWGDASFKTYCTPQDWPKPVAVAAGDRVAQGVSLSVLATPAVAVGPSPVTRLQIGDQVLPRARIGHLDNAGQGHVLLLLDPTTPWKERLAAAEFTRSRDGLPVVVTVPANAVTPTFAQALAAALPPDSELLVLDDASGSDCTAALALLRAAVRPEVPVGSGSRHQFTEVNRGVATVGELLGFAVNPLVHADDDWSLLTNTAAFADLATSAKAWGAPLRIGPLMLPIGDPRTGNDRGAAWLVAMLARLLPALDGDDAVTLAPTDILVGTPSGALIRAVAETTGLLPIAGTHDGIAAFAAVVRSPTGTVVRKRVFIANPTHLPAALLITGLRHGGEALHLAAWTMAILDG